MVYQLDKQLSEQGDKVPAEIKTPVEEGIKELKAALEASDTKRMKEVMQTLEAKMHKFAEELYKNAGAQQQAGAQPPPPEPAAGTGGKSGDDVIDADFKMVDEDKK